jgi:hypothetical protein
MSKISFLSFSAALTCNVWKRWNIIPLKNCQDNMCCCRWHIFTIKALLCISIFLYTWQWHVTQQKHTECILVFPWQQRLSKRATMLRITYIASLGRLPIFCTSITHVMQTCEFRKSATYSNKSATYSNKSATYSNKSATYSNKSATYSNKSAIYSNKSDTYSNKSLAKLLNV